MHHSYNQENTDFDMTSGFSKQYSPIDPSLEKIFAPSTPKHICESSAPHYDFHNHGLSAHDVFVPDAMLDSVHHAGYQGSMTPDSTANPIDPSDDHCHDAVEEPNQYATNAQEEDKAEYPLEFWKTLVDFEIPNFTETSINEIPGLQTLYAGYLSHHGPQSTTTNATRMQYAKALAFALLMHYHPASQGFTVAPASLGPVAKNGMNFILAADDKSDIWKDMRNKKKKKKKTNTTNKANRKRAPPQRELERAEKAEQVANVAEYNHEFAYMAKLQWDYIPPQDIAAFVVMCETETTDKKTGVATYEQHPHTYFAIMVDNFVEVPSFSTENIVHRSGILIDALCRGGKVQNGHGMLLYGPQLEFYAFDRGDEWVCPDSDDEDDEQKLQDIEPKMEVLQSGGQDLEFDLRTTGMDIVDAAFRDIAMREVVYMSEREAIADEGAGSADGDEDMEGE